MLDKESASAVSFFITTPSSFIIPVRGSVPGSMVLITSFASLSFYKAIGPVVFFGMANKAVESTFMRPFVNTAELRTRVPIEVKECS